MRIVNRSSKKYTVKNLMKNKRVVSSLVLVALLLLSTTTFFQVRQKKFNNQVSALQQEAIAQMADKDVYQRVHGDYTGDDVETLRPTTLSVNTTKVIQDYGVGIIRIPSIGMELPVLEGMNQANISIGAGTVKPNQRIGRGNFALLSHYMTDSGLLFGGLKNVSVGDEVELVFYGKTAIYEVEETRVIHQSEGQYMLDNPDKPHYLTLLTCDGSRVGTDYRLMVRGTLKEE